MSKHSMKRCWLHIVWSTKERFPWFQDDQQAKKCLEIIQKVCSDKGIYCKCGYVNPEHVHLLLDLPADMTIKTMMQNIKGIASHEVNDSGMFKASFSWARGYGAFSVSHSKVTTVVKYILNQKQHHKKISFKEEWALFEKKCLETVETVTQ